MADVDATVVGAGVIGIAAWRVTVLYAVLMKGVAEPCFRPYAGTAPPYFTSLCGVCLRQCRQYFRLLDGLYRIRARPAGFAGRYR